MLINLKMKREDGRIKLTRLLHRLYHNRPGKVTVKRTWRAYVLWNGLFSPFSWKNITNEDKINIDTPNLELPFLPWEKDNNEKLTIQKGGYNEYITINRINIQNLQKKIDYIGKSFFILMLWIQMSFFTYKKKSKILLRLWSS